MPSLCFLHAVERDDHRSIRGTPIETNRFPEMNDVVTAIRLKCRRVEGGVVCVRSSQSTVKQRDDVGRRSRLREWLACENTKPETSNDR
jgi:hypothetical protein